MCPVFKKVFDAVRKPDRITTFLRNKSNHVWVILSNGHPVAASCYILAGLTGWNLRAVHSKFLSWLYPNNWVVRDIHGVQMLLNLRNLGIAYELVVAGTRETKSTIAFRKLLRSAAGHDDIVVFDIGSNIGYFSLQAADLLDNATVYAFEPNPSNIRLLRANHLLNDTADQLHVVEKAVGAENEMNEIVLKEESNLSRMKGISGDGTVLETVEVETIRMDDFLADLPTFPGFSVFRIDVEGFEPSVFEGLTEFFETGAEGIVFVELHRGKVDTERHNQMVARLRDSGFDLQYVGSAAGHEEIEADSFDEIYPIETDYPLDHGGIHVIAKRV